jgi:hypothetical protein
MTITLIRKSSRKFIGCFPAKRLQTTHSQSSLMIYRALIPRRIAASCSNVGTRPPDESFLIKLDEYRETIAKAFKSKNGKLNGDQLTEVTQRTLDRLIFIRFTDSPPKRSKSWEQQRNDTANCLPRQAIRPRQASGRFGNPQNPRNARPRPARWRWQIQAVKGV